ncbi:DEAD/DEAH box helicase family protein [[Clostridium] dakarense]|uniref:DEAD/DEAH box helicase family protein n=1 Tax=Faecalimicrobium dakarense TaxID=1301100 RepID=UPI0004B1F473|nr:DEAD/DEAH box helicase family protein [[Clostridium] dakarense]
MIQRYLSQKFTREQVEDLFKKKERIQIITAPTGAGKTYFIQQNVIKIAKGEFKPFGASDRKALLLANRSALLDQIKEDLKNNLDTTYFETMEEEEYVTKYIDILSYQSVTKKFLEDINFLEKYKLIIADECHYFLNDSWNNTTQFTLNKFIEHSVDNTTLFLSATTEELKGYMNVIKDIELGGREIYNEVLSLEESMDLGFNDRLDITVTNDTLDNVMQNIPYNEKFVIFVNERFSKDKIEEYSNKYSYDNRLVGFLYSKWEQKGKGFIEDSEMSRRYKAVLKKEGFYDDEMLGIVANSAIDNGINFKMEDLKHIILLNQYDFVQMQQFIGRKRHNPNNINDRTNVYIISHNKDELISIKSKCDRTINYYKDYKNLSFNEFWDKHILEINNNIIAIRDYKNPYVEGLRIWKNSKRNTDFPFMVTITDKGVIEIHPNYCQIQKVACKLDIINGVLEQIKEFTMVTFFYDNLKKYYKNITIIEVEKSKLQKKHSAMEEIPVYLNKLKGRSMNKEQYKNLREYFRVEWDTKDSRNGRVLGDKAFKEYINEFGYSVMKGKGKKVGNTIPIIYFIVKE